MLRLQDRVIVLGDKALSFHNCFLSLNCKFFLIHIVPLNCPVYLKNTNDFSCRQ